MSAVALASPADQQVSPWNTGGLDRRPGITLAELNAAAELLTRVDRKYVLTPDVVATFVAALPASARVLQIDGIRSFRYTSTYFDTDGFDSFLHTARRRPRRGKVRSRTYLDSRQTFLEVKARRRGHTVKSRIPWETRSLDHQAEDFVTRTLADSGVELDGELSPVLHVDYRRSTILLPEAEARITIDSDLTYRLVEAAGAWPVRGLLIVETKSGTRPSPADRLLWRLGNRPRGISKYATGLAALRPELPRNRWHRLLRSEPFNLAG